MINGQHSGQLKAVRSPRLKLPVTLNTTLEDCLGCELISVTIADGPVTKLLTWMTFNPGCE